MLNGPAWLHCKTVPLVGLAFGTLASVATGGGGPMQSGGTLNGTPSSNVELPMLGLGSAGSFFGGNNGRKVLGHSAVKWPACRHIQHW